MLLVVIDDEHGVQRWLDAAGRHAEWLGAEARCLSTVAESGDHVGVGWSVPDGVTDSHGPGIEGALVHASTRYQDPRPSAWRLGAEAVWGDPPGAAANDAKVLVSRRSGELRALVSPATPSQLVYARGGGFVITDDIRILVRELGLEVDPRGVYALFQHGAIPAPLTISRGVERVPPGSLLRLRSRGAPVDVRPFVRLGPASGEQPPRVCHDQLRDALDGALAEVPRGSVLSFSGGVDSGLFAARFAELGRSDIQLVNLSLGAGDEQAELARRMATHLGLSLERVEYQPARAISRVLAEAGREYSFPFGDTAVLPSGDLLDRAVSGVDGTRVVVDGTGGALFSFWPKYARWRRVYRLPWPLRGAGSGAYRLAGLWRRNGRAERLGRVVRRSAQMSLPCAGATAQNPLAGIAYRFGAALRSDVDRLITRLPEALGPDLDPEKRFVLVDVLHPAAGHMAPKSFDFLARRGIAGVYPFLETPMIEFVLGVAWDDAFRLGTAKGQLKALLAQSVPSEMVYRPKASLIIDLPRTFSEPALGDFIGDVVLAPDGPLRPFFEAREVERMLRRCRRGAEMSIGAYYFLWTLTFSSAWLHAVASGADQGPRWSQRSYP